MVENTPTVVLIGTLDTKGPETAYLRDRIRENGLQTLVLDSGILGEAVGIEPDLTRQEVAKASGSDIDQPNSYEHYGRNADGGKRDDLFNLRLSGGAQRNVRSARNHLIGGRTCQCRLLTNEACENRNPRSDRTAPIRPATHAGQAHDRRPNDGRLQHALHNGDQLAHTPARLRGGMQSQAAGGAAG